jgi:endonuclease/exonuclease/phosphatase family metal-dependent hydrolase
VLVSEEIEVRHVYVPRTELSRVASDHLPLVVDFVTRDRP